MLQTPTIIHQLIVRSLLDSLGAFVDPRKLGVVLFAPLPVKLSPKSYREPDLISNFAENHAAQKKDYYERADLVMEVVSASDRDRKRDYDEKRRDYAKAGINEYWIVDPAEKRVTVLALEGDAYVPHCEVIVSGQASSKLLEGFVVNVADIFAAAKV